MDIHKTIKRLLAEIKAAEDQGEVADPDLYFQLGNTYYLEKEIDLSQRALTASILNARSLGRAGHPEASTNLGSLLQRHYKLFDEAKWKYEEAISDARSLGRAGNPLASFNLGGLLKKHYKLFDEAKGKYEEAISDARSLGRAGYPEASASLGVLMVEHYKLLDVAKGKYEEASRDAGGVFIPAHLALAKLIQKEEPSEALRLAAEVACKDSSLYGAVELLAQLHEHDRDAAKRYTERKTLVLHRLYAELDEYAIDSILKDKSFFENQKHVDEASLERVRFLLPHLHRAKISNATFYRIAYLLQLYGGNVAHAYHLLDDALDSGDEGYELSTIDKLLHLSLAHACAEPKEELTALFSEFKASEPATAMHDVLRQPLNEQSSPILSVPNSQDCYLHHYGGFSLAEVREHLKTEISFPEELDYNINEESKEESDQFAIKLAALILACWVHDAPLDTYLIFDVDEVRKRLLISAAAEKATRVEDVVGSLSQDAKKAYEDLDQAAHSDKWTLDSLANKLSIACTSEVPLSLLMSVLSESDKIPPHDRSKLRLYTLYCKADQMLRSGSLLSSDFTKEAANELVASILENTVAVGFTAFGYTLAGPVGIFAGGVSGYVAKNILARVRALVLNKKDRMGIEAFLAASSKELDKLEQVLAIV